MKQQVLRCLCEVGPTELSYSSFPLSQGVEKWEFSHTIGRALRTSFMESSLAVFLTQQYCSCAWAAEG